MRDVDGLGMEEERVTATVRWASATGSRMDTLRVRVMTPVMGTQAERRAAAMEDLSDRWPLVKVLGVEVPVVADRP